MSTCSEPGTNPPVEYITAQQRNTLEIYSKLSFNAAVSTKTEEEFTADLFEQTQVFHVSNRRGTLLFTRECSTAVEEIPQQKGGVLLPPVFRAKNHPLAMRLLVTEDYLINWHEISNPVASLYSAEDWKRTPNGYQNKLLAYLDVALPNRYCFGLYTPLEELLNHNSPHISWAVEVAENGVYQVVRTIQLPDGNSKTDLRMRFDSLHAVLLGAEFLPGKSRSVCSISYEELQAQAGKVLVPKSVLVIAYDTDERIVEETRVEYSDFRDESMLPAHQLSDLELPGGSSVLKKYPDGSQTTLLWRSGSLVDALNSD